MYLHLGRAEPALRATTETPGRVGSLALTRVLDTNSDPFRYICRIHVRTAIGGNSFGTGLLIGPYHVLTCAHILYPRDDPTARREVTVLPGQNGPDDRRPRSPANGWIVSPGWRWNDCRTADEDLGLIRLARPSNVGFWAVAPFEPSVLTGAAAHLAGYPARAEDPRAQWMYRSGGRIVGRIQIDSCTEPTPRSRGSLTRTLFRDITDATKFIAHDLDTGPSMSGSPLWSFREGKRALIAVHAGDIDNGARKKAVLLNTVVRTRISEWMTRTLPPLRNGRR